MKTGDFWRQILLMVIIVVVAVFVTLAALSYFTRHGEEIKVADIRGLRIEQLSPYREEFGFEFVVRDSVYDPDAVCGTILAQSPQPGSIVKKGRTFYIVIAACMPASVRMPDLRDLSQRQAEALLETYGLKVGRKIPVSSIAKGAVVRQLIRGEVVDAGATVRRGTVIDLEIGDGRGSLPTTVYDTVGADVEDLESEVSDMDDLEEILYE